MPEIPPSFHSLPDVAAGPSPLAAWRWRGDEQILVLGCGDGVEADRLARRVPRGYVLGIDPAEPNIRLARAYARGNLDFSRQTVNSISFQERFDLIWSDGVLQEVSDHRDLLTRTYRAVRPGGLVGFRFWSADSEPEPVRCLRQAMEQVDFAARFQTFSWPWFMPTVAQYERLVATLPFRTTRVSCEKGFRMVPDAEALTEWLDRVLLPPFFAVLPTADERDLFRAYVLTALLMSVRQPDGRCRLASARLIFTGRKLP